MNIKHLIKPVAVLAFVCGAPALQAQVLGGGAGGGLGGSLGGTLGGGMGSVGGMGQGNAAGAIGGSIERGDTLRRSTSGAVERTRDTTGRARDRVTNSASTVGDTAKKQKPRANADATGSGSLTGSLDAPKAAPAEPAQPRSFTSPVNASANANANGDASASTHQPQ